jgi:hypothetical protein
MQIIKAPNNRFAWLSDPDLAFEFLAPIGLLIIGGIQESLSAFALGVISMGLLSYRRKQRPRRSSQV